MEVLQALQNSATITSPNTYQNMERVFQPVRAHQVNRLLDGTVHLCARSTTVIIHPLFIVSKK